MDSDHLTTQSSQAPTVSEASHTPGPWRRGSDDLASPELFSEVYADNGYLVAVCQTGHLRGKDRREAIDGARANARLIAAAPELLVALGEAINLIESWHGPAAWDIYRDHSPEMRRLNDAIAKATGGAA